MHSHSGSSSMVKHLSLKQAIKTVLNFRKWSIRPPSIVEAILEACYFTLGLCPPDPPKQSAFSLRDY